MKTDIKRIIANVLTILLAAGLLTAWIPVSGPVAAARVYAESSSEIGVGDHVIMGNKDARGYTGLPYWRVIDRNENGEVLLLSEYLWKGDGRDPDALIKFNADKTDLEKAIAWQGSDAQDWCRGFERAVLGSVEGLEIIETSKSDEEFPSPDQEDVIFAASENILQNDRVFFLSAQEAAEYLPSMEARIAYTHDGMNTGSRNAWWLRSPRKMINAECAGRVFSVGAIGRLEVDGGNSGGLFVRPAFWASLNSEESNDTWTIVHSCGEPEYTWAADNSSCTATAICENCGAEVTETAEAQKTTVKATAKADGLDTYTAEFSNEAFETQVKKTVIPRLVVAGEKYTVSGSTYKVISAKSLTATLVKAKNMSKFTVPSTIKISGKTLKVVQVDAKALTGSKIRSVTVGANVKTLKKNSFAGSKATAVVLKTKLLKKNTVKGCFTSSKVKTVQVKVGTAAQNKKIRTAYKKFFTKSVLGKAVTLK